MGLLYRRPAWIPSPCIQASCLFLTLFELCNRHTCTALALMRLFE